MPGMKTSRCRSVTQAHDVTPAVPAVETADHAYASGIGGPDGEGDAIDAIDRAGMGAHHLIGPEVVALAQQMQVEIADDGRESVGILGLRHMAVPVDSQAIGEALVPAVERTGEDAGVVDAGQFGDRAAIGGVHHRHRSGARQTGPDHEFSAAGFVHAEHPEGIRVIARGQGVEDVTVEGLRHYTGSVSVSRRVRPASGMRNQSGRFAAS